MHFKKILICHLGVVKNEFASERKKDSEPHTVLEKKCKKLFVFFHCGHHDTFALNYLFSPDLVYILQ